MVLTETEELCEIYYYYYSVNNGAKKWKLDKLFDLCFK